MLTTSVALCTYNGAKFIEDQLRSILSQTRAPDEILLVDDASSDQTTAIAEGLRKLAAERKVDLRIMRNPVNLGYIKNFEKAVSYCKGDVILLCDQDDVWLPPKVETLLACFEADPQLLLVYSDALVVDAELRSLGFTQSEALNVTSRELALLERGRGFDALLVRNLVTGATVAFKNELLEHAVPFSTTWIHDEWLAITAAAVGKIHFCVTPLIHYRQHSSNQIGMRRRYLSERLRSMFRVRGQFYELQVKRAEALKRHLEYLGSRVSREKIDRLNDRLSHLRFRAALPSSRLARITPALAEWRAGRYREYSNGLRAVVRDLFEPT